ncbi:hypothetical protein D6783_02215 [Candidatus Woesearchaeota archaeon]|nr:MAG: hypothetical protein D6783_02215 [Candidatus Woesearchaeota archaeon]
MTTKLVLSREEEFQILKLVLDKFLWIGTFLVLLGLWQLLVSDEQTWLWLWLFFGGICLFFFFLVLLLKWFHVRR